MCSTKNENGVKDAFRLGNTDSVQLEIEEKRQELLTQEETIQVKLIINAILDFESFSYSKC
jgi:hypothetical protein